jgi:hypothetical protein
VVQDVADPNHAVRQPEDTHITSIRFVPGSGGRDVYAAGLLHCRTLACPPVLFRSHDGGATWRRLQAAGFEGTQLVLPPSPQDHRIFAMSPAGLQVSDDGGASFRPAAMFGGSVALGTVAISPAFNDGDPSILIGSQTLMRYSDEQGVIEPAPYPLTAPLEPAYAPTYPTDTRIVIGGISVDPARGERVSTVFVCTGTPCSGIRLGTVSEPPKIRLAPDFETSGVIYAFTARRLFVSRDGGESFREASAPVTRGVVADVAMSPDTTFLALRARGVHRVGGGLYVSRADAPAWHRVASPLFRFGTTAAVVSETRILVSLAMGGVACSTDGGRTWSRRC